MENINKELIDNWWDQFIKEGDSYYNVKNYKSAMKCYEKLPPSYESAELYLKKGLCYYYTFNYEMSLQFINKSLNLNDTIQQGNSFKARSLAHLDMCKDAYLYCDKEIYLYPNSAESYLSKAVVYNIEQKNNDAIKLLEKALEIDPNNPNVYNNLGIAYSDLNYNEKAIEYYHKSITIDPTHFLTYYNLGILYQDKNEFEKSLIYYNKSIELNQDYPRSYYNKACVLAHMKSYDDAINCFRISMNLNKNYYEEGIVNIGIMYTRKGFYKNAMKCFEKGIKLNRKNAHTYVYMSESLFYQALYHESIEYFNRFSLNQAEAEEYNSYENALRNVSIQQDFKI